MISSTKNCLLTTLVVVVPLVYFSRASHAEFRLPNVKVGQVRIAYTDDNHNAFTDLCKFRGQYYLTFRNCPDGHGVYDTSHILILVSDDAKTWKQIFKFNVPLRDVRDPHFLVFKDKLFVYSGCWLAPTDGQPREFNDHLGYGVWTEDGKKWHGPRPLEGTYGHYIWRATSVGDKAYLCARRKRHFIPTTTREQRNVAVESAMLESDDGLIWKYVSLFQSDRGNETALWAEEDGSITALARGTSGQKAQLCRARPPYKKFSRVELNRQVSGPLIVKWNGNYLVGGRKVVDESNPRTALYWLVDHTLHEFAVLPSGGDNSYPGFVQMSDNRALLSYYSSHQGEGDPKTRAAIYLVELEHDE